MKKGLKALSAVLALSMGLVGANMVSAYKYYSYAPNGLTKEAVEFIALPQSEEAVNQFYTSLTDNKAFRLDLKDAKDALAALAKDTHNHAAINTAVCNAAQAIESIDNELRASAHLRALAETYGATTTTKLAEKIKTELEGNTDIAAGMKAASFGEHRAAFLKALKDYDDLKDKYVDNEKLGETTNPYGLFLDEAKTVHDTRVDLLNTLKKEAKIITSEPYQKAAARVAKYLPENANATVADLRAERTNLNGLIKFGQELLHKHHMKLDACELPEGLKLEAAAKTEEKTEAKKDSLPNTAAASTAAASTVAILFSAAAAVVAKKKASEL